MRPYRRPDNIRIIRNNFDLLDGEVSAKTSMRPVRIINVEKGKKEIV